MEAPFHFVKLSRVYGQPPFQHSDMIMDKNRTFLCQSNAAGGEHTEYIPRLCNHGTLLRSTASLQVNLFFTCCSCKFRLFLRHIFFFFSVGSSFWLPIFIPLPSFGNNTKMQPASPAASNSCYLPPLCCQLSSTLFI